MAKLDKNLFDEIVEEMMKDKNELENFLRSK